MKQVLPKLDSPVIPLDAFLGSTSSKLVAISSAMSNLAATSSISSSCSSPRDASLGLKVQVLEASFLNLQF
jgi:hypothetical protein